MTSKRKITIEFESDEAAMYFARWLCDAGEQNYWDWMGYRESEDHRVVSFDYWGGDDGQFMHDWTIRTECGIKDDQ